MVDLFTQELYTNLMPTYSYSCLDCQNSFELFFTIAQYTDKPKCEACQSNNTCRDYQTDMKSIVNSVIKSDSELKTIGDLANRNRDKLSNDQKAHLEHKHNSYKETPSDKPLPKGMSRIKKPSHKIKWR
jgi:putative FmdB family regulatory protein